MSGRALNGAALSTRRGDVLRFPAQRAGRPFAAFRRSALLVLGRIRGSAKVAELRGAQSLLSRSMQLLDHNGRGFIGWIAAGMLNNIL